MKKVCVATGSRAEYGLLRPILKKLKSDNEIDLRIVVTGMHLSPEFGFTVNEITNDGFKVDFKNEMLLSSDTDQGIVKSMGVGLIGMADYFSCNKPDMLIVLGDRYEIFAVATAAMIYKVPIAHIHGGEITEGAYDDSIRHCITKMSTLHFTSTEEYRKRVIQLGESPDRVFYVGALGVENIKSLKLMEKDELEDSIGFRVDRKTLMVTYHPETLGEYKPADCFKNLLYVLDKHREFRIIFTKANADTDGRIINSMIDEYVDKHKLNSIAFQSLGILRYLSVLKYCAAVVGNSSSGILEVPSFKIPTINIGNRQKGRVQSKSVINCRCIIDEIDKALSIISDIDYISKFKNYDNPYELIGTSSNIVKNIKNYLKSEHKNKKFYDYRG